MFWRFFATSFTLALVCVVASQAALAQGSSLADFTDHPQNQLSPWGTYNVTNSNVNVPTTHAFGDQIEDDEWVITVFSSADGNYRIRTFHKPTLTEELFLIGSSNGLVAAASPALCFVPEPVPAITGGVRSVAVVFVSGILGVNSDVMITFLDFVPGNPNASPPVLPRWMDSDRADVNVSRTGSADNPSVTAFATGDIVVTWADSAPTGAIGGKTGINPTLPSNPSPGFVAKDIYCRRFQSEYTAFLPGVVDSEPNGSTVNVSNSRGNSDFCRSAGDGSSFVYVSWIELGAASSTVGGLPTGSGPQGGQFGGNGETRDVFVRKIVATIGMTNLTTGTADNVSLSSGDSGLPAIIPGGPTNPQYNPDVPKIAFNPVIRQVAVTFYDNTIDFPPPGPNPIAGVLGLFAEPITNSGTGIQTPVYDLFYAIYSDNLARSKTDFVTRSQNGETTADLASWGSEGWLVTYSARVPPPTPLSPLDVRTEHLRIDVTGKRFGPSVYPVQLTVPQGGNVAVVSYSISGLPGESVHVGFSLVVTQVASRGWPANLKAAQPAANFPGQQQSAVGAMDYFIAAGEAFPPQGSTSPIRIPRKTVYPFFPNAEVNSAEEDFNERARNNPVYDPNRSPAAPRVVVAFEVRNADSVSQLNLQQLTVSPPVGFEQATPNPLPSPIVIGSNLSRFFTVEFDVDPSKIRRGTNEFSVSASGVLAGIPQVTSEIVVLNVIGSSGDLIGVRLTAQVNPTQIITNRSNTVTYLIAVENGGQEALTDIEFSGQLIPGVNPADFKFATFSPDLDNAEVPSGEVRVFTASLLLGPQVNGNDSFTPSFYSPAVTMAAVQASSSGGSGRVGTITTAVQVPLDIDAPAPEEVIPPPPIINVSSSGCTGSQGQTAWWLLLSAALFLLGTMAYRRRNA